MNETFRSILVGTAGLALLAAAAGLLTGSRGLIVAEAVELRAAVRVATLSVLLQAIHFAEESVAGFRRDFPELLGLDPWPPAFFVSFNLLWLGVWALSIPGLAARRRIGLFPLWFLGLASAANGVVHPLIAIRLGGYFPGLLTSPLVGVAGVVLLRRLAGVTREPG